MQLRPAYGMICNILCGARTGGKDVTAQKKRELFPAAVAAGLIVCAAAARAVTRGQRDAGYFLPVSLLRSMIYVGLMAWWGVSLRRRIIQTQARRCLVAIAALCVLWLGIRTVKFFFAVTPAAVRYLWYGYYFPMLFIPLLCVFVALSLGRPENYRLPRWTRVLYIPAVLLLALVLTNDLHRLVFVFPAEAVWLDTDHTYGGGYFAVMAWIAEGMGTAVAVMLLKCRIPHSRVTLGLPFVPVGLAALYTALYVAGVGWLRRIAGDMTVVQCLLLAAGIESCIRCGMIQSNTGYEALFEASGIRAEITDKALTVRAASAPHALFPEEKLRLALCQPVELDRNTLLKSSPIRTGYVFWQEDISELQDALDALRLVREELRDTGDVLKEENEQKARRLKLEEQTRLYELIEREAAPQFARLEALLSALSAVQSQEEAQRLLGRVAVIMTYIKRRSNLVFLAAQRDRVDADELLLCLNESAQALSLCGVCCAVRLELGGTLPAARAVALYDLFGAVLDTGRSLRAMLLSLRREDGAIRARVSAACDEPLDGLCARFPGLTAEHDEDGLWHLTWSLGEAAV